MQEDGITAYVLLKQKLLPFRNTFCLSNCVESNIYLPVIYIFSAFFYISTYSTDNLLTRLNRYIHSAICKLMNIVWWSSRVQINPYTSRSFLDHVSSAPHAPPSRPPPAVPWLVSSHSSVSYFSPYVSSRCLQHSVSWPSSMASTHWEHHFVCWRKRAYFEPSTWSLSMMMSECHLLAVPWKMCATLSPSLCCFCLGFFFFSSCTTHYSLHCDNVSHSLLEVWEICVQPAGLPQIIFCVNSGSTPKSPHVFLFTYADG